MKLGHALCAAAILLSLAGCGSNFRRTVGLAAPPPDEFLVVSRRPLEAPPDLRALPTPRPGAPSLVDPNPETEAQTALLGSAAAPAAGAPSPGEAALLDATGASAVEPIDRERIAEAPAPRERRFGLDSFLGFEIDQNPEAGEDALAAREEAERLRREGVPAPVPPPAPAAP